jgi:hypothetical protein
MTDAIPLHWSQRGYAWFLLAATFVLGVFAGLMLANAGEFQRLVRQSERTAQEAQRVIDQRAQRPSLQERFDVLEERLRAIEQRLTPVLTKERE